MKRITTDSPKSSEENMHNIAYIKDNEIWLRECGENDENVRLTEFVTGLCKKCHCDAYWPYDFPNDDGTFVEYWEHMNTCGIMGCHVADVYALGIQAAEVRERLKEYEDTGLSPDQIEELNSTLEETPFCPRCGAKIDGKKVVVRDD